MENLKNWSKPQLIVLGRGNPEEKVLQGCKSAIGTGPGSSGCQPTRQSQKPPCQALAIS